MVGTSTRHLSFIETGRSRPRRELVLRLAECLDVPVRERNAMLVAAGLAPAFVERSLEDAGIAPYRRALEQILRRHEPYPASVINLFGEVLLTNRAADALWPGVVGVPAETMLDGSLAPGPGRESLENFAEVAWALTDRLQREALQTQHPRLAALHERAVRHLRDLTRPAEDAHEDVPVTPLRLRVHGRVISCFVTVMRFESARDVTMSELRVEQVFPEDDEADAFFRSLTLPPPAAAPAREARG